MSFETYISVDVETAGPIPALYALLSIGACLVGQPDEAFYIELQPDRTEFLAQALAVSGLDPAVLQEKGIAPADAMRAFQDWVKDVTPAGTKPVFVGFNAPFDWMFIADYFHRYLGSNPFGHSALDIKAYYMGQTGVSWLETSMKHISARLLEERTLEHNALRDARDQAEIFNLILNRDPGIVNQENN